MKKQAKLLIGTIEIRDYVSTGIDSAIHEPLQKGRLILKSNDGSEQKFCVHCLQQGLTLMESVQLTEVDQPDCMSSS